MTWRERKPYINTIFLYSWLFFFSLFTGVPISYSTERIETVDEANMMASYSLIDGDIMVGFYNKMKATAQVIPKGNGSILKWILEFEKANEEVPDPSAIMEFGIKTFHDIDAYLLNA